MLEITIDVSEIVGFGDALAASTGMLTAEMTRASAELLTEGVGYAQEYAPVRDGDLRASIHITDGPHASGGAYGTSIEYAYMREYGGTIVPRNARMLAFEVDGRLVFAHKVTQSGSHYMERSRDSLEPRVLPAYEAAIDRVMAGL